MQHTGKIPHLAPWRALFLYVSLGLLWFAAAELIVPSLVSDSATVATVHRWHAYVFVLLTGIYAAWQVWSMMRAEAVRSAAMQEFFHVVRYAPVGIARVKADTGQLVWANDRLYSMLGMGREALLQSDFRELVKGDDAALREAQFKALVGREVDHVQHERRIVLPDGSEMTVLCTVALVDASANNPVLVYVLQDLTEVEQARHSLARNAEQLQMALDGSGSGMWDWDVKADCFTFSEHMSALLHYTGTDLQAEVRIHDMLHPEDKAHVYEQVEKALKGNEALKVSARLLCFDGQYRWFQARGKCHLDKAGHAARMSGVLTDQTEYRSEQDRLRLAATVVDNAAEGMVVTDARNHILSVNPAFTRLLGFTEDELRGQTPRVFKSGRHGPDFYQAMWATIQRTGHWRGEIWNRRKSGEIFPERMSLNAVRNAQGVVTHYVCLFTDISEEKAQQQKLEFLAHNDALTGLPNRNGLGQAMGQAVQEAAATGERMAVLLLNLNRFKDVNDSYGHRVGDEVLKHIAHQVRGALGSCDLIGRMAGDEIIVVARHLQSRADAEAAADRLIAAAAQPWESPDDFSVVVDLSVGICMYPDQAGDVETLLQGAHAAVYGAKQGQGEGRGWCFYDEDMTAAARERMELEARLRQAVKQQDFELHYQPQVDISTGRIMGCEALLRWRDEQGRYVSPAKFIPVAESSGLIGPIGEWVIKEGARQAQAWREAGLDELTVAVNVSPHQFLISDIVECTERALRETGLPATALELEITESALAERPDEALQVLRRLRALGVRLAVDDFGTGYSSLAHLKRFPIDVLKIDQGFIRDIPRSTDDMAISKAIIAMGRSLDLKVLAEGVETPEHLAFLQDNGCDYYQGYFCSKPLPPAHFASLVRERRGPDSLGRPGGTVVATQKETKTSGASVSV